MIKKQFRLKERKVRKVLWKSKPFFSSWIILNKKWNKKLFNRFSIVIWWKSVNTNVTRVFFRRFFFNIIKESNIFNVSSCLENNKKSIKYYDFVFVVKKQTKLDRKDIKALKSFKNDLNFLIKKVK